MVAVRLGCRTFVSRSAGLGKVDLGKVRRKAPCRGWIWTAWLLICKCVCPKSEYFSDWSKSRCLNLCFYVHINPIGFDRYSSDDLSARSDYV